MSLCLPAARGAGARCCYVRPDGSFSGTFGDTTWEEYGGSTRAVLLCSEFTGQFTEPVRVNDYTYSVRIARIDYERAVGEEAFADGFHYYYTEPRGLEDTEELLIYLPGAPLGELPQEFRGWVDHGDQGEALLSYALNNEAHQQALRAMTGWSASEPTWSGRRRRRRNTKRRSWRTPP